jgi:anaerobic selenocysteine-containing dehydrogenase/Fe-S-cluster-containing dehydrogenase component
MNLNRRAFLKIAGIGSVSMAAACTAEPEKTLYTLVEAPDDMVTGKAAYYASTCRECPAGCGTLAKNREGRIVKLEGNPSHPVNRGNLCMRGQAAIQGIYNPDRIRSPMIRENNRWQPISFRQAETILRGKTKEAAEQGINRVHMLSEVIGDSLLTLLKQSMKNWRSDGPLLFEPYAYESLKKANHTVFGTQGLPSYRMDRADLLVSFGADFLETWLSPVEYAWKFKTMHAYRHGEKGLYFHVGPYQTLTGANADRWMPCYPGGEYAIVLGALKEALRNGKGRRLPDPFRESITKIASPYDRETVVKASGISAPLYDALVSRLLSAKAPLIIGTGTGTTGPNGFQTNVAVNILNLVMDPSLSLIDFQNRHRVETAADRATVLSALEKLKTDPPSVLLLNNVNPVYSLGTVSAIDDAIAAPSTFVISFSNFIDETTRLSDLIFPARLPLESWDEYDGHRGTVSTLQPAMGALTEAPNLGDIFLQTAFEDMPPEKNYKRFLIRQLFSNTGIADKRQWIKTLADGGRFISDTLPEKMPVPKPASIAAEVFQRSSNPVVPESVFIATPSIRYLDGRTANRPWLSEIPNPITKVAWQTPVLIHPKTLKQKNLAQGDRVRLESKYGRIEAPVYEYEGVLPGVAVMEIGQGHHAFGRYAKGVGANPLTLVPRKPDAVSGSPQFSVGDVSITAVGSAVTLASTSGSRVQHGRKIALTVDIKQAKIGNGHKKPGVGMDDFPMTLPLPEGYDEKRDFYPPHEHIDYRWSMIVDLDRCIGCSACAAACYAENNLGVAGVDRIQEGREMAWLSVERYHHPDRMEDIMFLPMLCQHCDNAPCESVCPVYAPHHSKEGINNQIYNRCIGTRFCSQNCPYKVRRFNWYTWRWPKPLQMQLNPDVTVRSKGVMEKCSFCIQRIKTSHTVAKNEKRKIRDGEVTPACVQTCPTGALVFGNLMDKKSRVRRLADDPRAYQVMGYLNTKPAVIYLKKVIQEI